MIDLKKRFEQFEKAGYYIRADNEHILELYIGLDENGNKSIELRALFRPRKVKGTSAIEINQYHNPRYNTIRFSLKDNDISGLFYMFCEDMIEQTKELRDKSEGYNAIVLRFYQWKKMFVSDKKNLLSEPEIMGIIGELLFLKEHLSKRTGLHKALMSWSGQELTHKDFSYDDTWTEVKTVRKNKCSVRISSLEQLESKNTGELFVFFLEKMSPEYNGITLNSLVLEIRNMFEDDEDRNIFLAKTSLQGYQYHDYYNDFVYEQSCFRKFRVSDGFPRMTSENIPEGIISATYDIDINKLNDFEVTEI